MEDRSRRKFYRSRDDRLIGGVAGGFAEYFGIDPLVVRIGFLLLAIFAFPITPVAYLVLWAVVPLQSSTKMTPGENVRENVGEMGDVLRKAAEGLRDALRGRRERPPE